jgi:lipopolysaccharide biosynthesis regulator YciM
MFELLFLLLPVAALYGYYMGRSSVRNKQENARNQQNHNYLRGVEYLLNKQDDKAVDRFIACLKDQDPSFESSLALGNLFRTRGEVDKAISLHERMIADESVDDSERETAQLELACDFLSAGLLDRAEQILLKAVEIPRQRAFAAKLLLKVYEREQDFNRAIEVALAYRDVLGSSGLRMLGQYYCEKASHLFASQQYEEASKAYRYAIETFPRSIRARLELASIYIKQNKLNEAYSLVKEVTAFDQNYGITCLALINECFPNKADPNYRFALESLVNSTHSAAAMVELVRIVSLDSGMVDAENLLLSFIKEKPNLKLFSALMGLRSKEGDPSANQAILQLKSLVDAQIAANYIYTCPHCGFESKMLFWQCPSCKRWESLKPKVGLDGD